MRPTFTSGDPRGVGEHHRHLQDDLQLVPDGVGREGVEGLGAVAGLEQEGLAGGHLRQLAGERAGLAGEDQRGRAPRSLHDCVERAWSGQSGCWAAGSSRHDEGDQVAAHGAPTLPVVGARRKAVSG